MTRPKYLGGLGFRDLELLNLALLAKQSWIILQDLTSFSTRILKASYFPDGTIINVELGCQPYKIWCGVLEARDIVKQGIICRIRNCQSTNIWADNWIPKESSLRPIVSLVVDPLVKVSTLLSPTTASWNEKLVWSIFLPIDADETQPIFGHGIQTRKVDSLLARHRRI